MKKYIILSLISLFIGFSSSSFAQAPANMQGGGRNSMPYSQRPAVGTVTGIILDSETGQPMEFATVSLRVSPSDSIVSGGLTDKKGRFTIEKVRVGMHKLEISFIGYNTQLVEKVMIRPDAPLVDAGTVNLKPSDAMIKEVNVTGEKSFVRNTVDKKIYSVDKLNASEGSSVTEALANIPAVNVDGDGNVSLRGSTNVKFLINGKPSAMLNDGSSILEQLPASSIQSVEVITNPSAKYDPDGMTGIINIVMKENREKGFNGSVSANYGFFDKYNGSLNLNYRNGKLNTFVSGSVMQRTNIMDGYNLRTDTRETAVDKFLEQNIDGKMGMNSYMLRYGFDYTFNSKNSLTFSGSNGLWSHSRAEDIEYRNLNYLNELTSSSYRSSKSSYGRNPFDLNLSYELKFSNPAEKLTVDMMYSGSNGNNEAVYKSWQTENIYTNQQNTFTEAFNENMMAQADYIKPLTIGELGFGVKSQQQTINADYSSESFNTTNNAFETDGKDNNFTFSEYINSAYISYNAKILKFNVQAGLRGEQAKSVAKLVNESKAFENPYISLFPTLHTSYNLNQSNELRLSYTKRINRPNQRNMNPFIDNSDPLNIQVGNPYLTPEYIHSFEAGYSKTWKSASFTTSAYFRQINDKIERVKTIDENTGISTTLPLNLTQAQSFGTELGFIADLTKFWNLNTSFDFYRMMTEGTAEYPQLENDGYGWNVKAISNFKIPGGVSAQLSGRYNSKIIVPQGYLIPSYSFDVSARRNFLKNKATLSLRVSDILNTQKFGFYTETGSFVSDSWRKPQSRTLYITFSYRFGNQQMEMKKKRTNMQDSGNEMEQQGIERPQ